MTASVVGAPTGQGSGPDRGPGPAGGAASQRPLLVTGTLAAAAATGAGLATATLLVLIGWIAAPHAGAGLPAVLRTSAALWLAGQHVGFTLRGAGRIGLLPLGLVALPGALLWRAGRWIVRVGQVRRLRHVGYSAVALALPYALITGALALVSRSPAESSSVSQSVCLGFLLALAAGGLGGARALAPWPQLIRLLPRRPRSVFVGVAGALATLAGAGALLAGLSLLVHLREAAALGQALDPGVIGTALLLLLQLAYLPNAVMWGIAFSLGPGFAFGTGTVVAPTGSALAQLPALPILAALPPGLHTAIPAWLEPTVLALPYLAGAVAGVLLVRAAPALALDAAPLWGLASGVLCGVVLGLLAALSGGPLGDGRLSAVGPSGWQTGAVSALELGVAAAVAAGLSNYLGLRRAGAIGRPLVPAPARPTAAPAAGGPDGTVEPPARTGDPRYSGGPASPVPDPAAAGHVIYVDPWAGDRPRRPRGPAGPSALP